MLGGSIAIEESKIKDTDRKALIIEMEKTLPSDEICTNLVVSPRNVKSSAISPENKVTEATAINKLKTMRLSQAHDANKSGIDFENLTKGLDAAALKSLFHKMTARERQEYKEWIQTMDNEIEEELKKLEEQELEETKNLKPLTLKNIDKDFFIARPGHPN